jgi:hypothetical protein
LALKNLLFFGFLLDLRRDKSFFLNAGHLLTFSFILDKPHFNLGLMIILRQRLLATLNVSRKIILVGYRAFFFLTAAERMLIGFQTLYLKSCLIDFLDFSNL